MKKIFTAIIAVLLALVFPMTVYADASSVQFVDKKTEATFIIPSGWKLVNPSVIEFDADYCFELQEPDEEEDEVVTYITYSSFAFDSEDKKDIAEKLVLKEKKLKEAVYNKVDYYRFETKAEKFTPHFGEKGRCVGYVTVKDGFMYQIMFFDSIKNVVYDDFKSLMGSIEIKGTVPDKPAPKKIITPKTIIGLGITGLVLILFIVLIIKTKKE